MTSRKPDSIPAVAKDITIAELADRYRELKPPGTQRLRLCFPIMRFTPFGAVKALTRTADGGVQLTLIQGELHFKRYAFTADQAAATTGWYWMPSDETALRAAA